jgi:hypothetical protein
MVTFVWGQICQGPPLSGDSGGFLQAHFAWEVPARFDPEWPILKWVSGTGLTFLPREFYNPLIN